MPIIEVIQHSSLLPALRAEILALCSNAYEEDFAPYFQLLESATHVLAVESGRIVSHAAWVPRQLRLGTGGLPIRCAYVEAVATPVDLQRRGLGTLVLRAIPPLLEEFDLAALSPSEPDFYARSGWEMWKGSLFYLRDGVRGISQDDEVMIHRLPGTPANLNTSAELEADWREGDVW
jgi:aminoglycoside 2'-N-acetyltransferase I